MQNITPEVARQITVTVDEFRPSDETGAHCRVRLTVDNGSDIELDSGSHPPFRLSYHWRDAETGEMRVYEGDRTDLPKPLPARSQGSYPLRVRTPDEPGEYRFEAALVQEHVMWLDGMAHVSPLPTVVRVDHKQWWAPGDTTNPFSTHGLLNRESVRKRLTHAAGYRPVALFCETINLCNNACIICAYDKQTRAQGVMSTDLFEKMLHDYTEIGGGRLSLTPVVGDVLLDRHLVERVRLCEKYPAVTSVSFTTNAAMADQLDDKELEYVLSRMQRVFISVYGMDENEYRTMTRRDTYARMRRGIDRILQFARHEVAIGFRLLNRRAPGEAERWLEGIPGYRGTKASVTIHPPIYTYFNWGVLNTDRPLPGDAQWAAPPGRREQCLVPILGLQVYWNGKVSFCPCDDFDLDPSLSLGDLMQSSLAEIYSGEKLRRLWNWQEHGVPEFCKKCSAYQPLTNIVTAQGDIFDDPLLVAGA